VAVESTTGRLYSWGKNDSGQLGLGTFTQKEMVPVMIADPAIKDQEIVQIACGCYHTLALTCKLRVCVPDLYFKTMGSSIALAETAMGSSVKGPSTTPASLSSFKGPW